MQKSIRPFIAVLWSAAILICSAVVSVAHTLPISFLTVVSNPDEIHVEWVFNPFELSFFSELDENHDSRLSSSELARHEKFLEDRLLQILKVKADGKALTPKSAGLISDSDGHHLTFRIHFAAPKSGARLDLESNAPNLMGGSHITQVRFGRAGHFQTAQLDSQTRQLQLVPGSVLARNNQRTN